MPFLYSHNTHFTREEKRLIRAYALKREQAERVVKVRFLACGDVRAYTGDGYTYLIAPTSVLLEEAKAEAALPAAARRATVGP